MPDMKEVGKTFRRKLRGDDERPKIPVVPRFDDEGKLVKAPKITPPKIAEKDVMEEDLEMEKSLEEQEERLREFEREKRLGKQGAGVVTQQEDGKRVDAEVTDDIAYPRDVVGTKFRKEKVKYKYDLYVPSSLLCAFFIPVALQWKGRVVLIADMLRKITRDF
jgi:predicted ribosome quality control (RQC) complex YloA/Tae2 family protein